MNVINDPADTLNEEDYQKFFNQSSSQRAMETLKAWGVVGIPVTWKTPRAYWGVTHIKPIKNYYESLENGVQPDITAEEAVKTQALICAIYQSAKEKRTVHL